MTHLALFTTGNEGFRDIQLFEVCPQLGAMWNEYRNVFLVVKGSLTKLGDDGSLFPLGESIIKKQ